MKKILSAFVLLLLALLIVGCGESNDEPMYNIMLEEKEVTLNIGETYEIKPVINEANLKFTVLGDEEYIEILPGGIIKAIKDGEIIVTVQLNKDKTKYDTLKVIIKKAEVNPESIPQITLDGVEKDITIDFGEDYDYKTGVKAIDKEDGDITSKIIILNSVDKTKPGKYTVTYKVNDNDGNNAELVRNVTVREKDETKPVIELLDNDSKVYEIGYNKEYDPALDLKATDDRDGDITDKIVVTKKHDKLLFDEEQTVEVSVSDKAGNTATLTRKVKVVWNYQTKVIGHRGSIYGVPNTEEAFLYAARDLHYQALECDVRVTSDGVLVINHDATYSGMTVESTTYAKLAATTITSSPFALPKEKGFATGSYSGHICTLERYLEICKQYGCAAVIEFKSTTGISGSSQTNIPKVIDLLNKTGMYNNAIILTSMSACLKWFRNNGYKDIKLQYLVNSFESSDTLSMCKQYDFDISTNVTGSYSNSDEWLNKYRAAGLEISVWTFTSYCDYDVVQEWIDKGVDYVTCDWQPLDKMTFYEKDKYIKLDFLTKDGKLLNTKYTFIGQNVTPFDAPTENGYKFIKWEGELTNVSKSQMITPVYELITYDINYNECTYKLNEIEWENKDAFIDEFYGDYFEWLSSKAGVLPQISKSGNSISVHTNDTYNGSCTISSKDDLKSMDIYAFESALSAYFYKPIKDKNGPDYVSEIDDNYFLNTEPYRTKYFRLNEYFYNAMLKSFTKVSKLYEPDDDMKVGLFNKFQQWVKGTSMAVLNTLPTKYEKVDIEGAVVTLPTEHLTYNVEEEFDLPVPTSTKGTFGGWYARPDFKGDAITKIEKGTFGNITLYAKWIVE